MPALTADQLSALARTGALNREIEASLGRAMTPDERAVVDRARVVWRLQREAKRTQRGPGNGTEHGFASEKMRLDAAKAEAQEMQNRVRAGELVERAEVEAAHAEMREVLRGGLASLALRLAGDLAGRKQSAPAVRAVVQTAIADMVRGWSDAEIPVPDD